MRMAMRVTIATLCGAVVGWERSNYGSEAGIRTYGAVALGACAFGLVSSHVEGAPDPSRIAAQVVSGMGFIGAGVIIRDGGTVTGRDAQRLGTAYHLDLRMEDFIHVFIS